MQWDVSVNEDKNEAWANYGPQIIQYKKYSKNELSFQNSGSKLGQIRSANWFYLQMEYLFKSQIFVE